jgi:uncharacterized protein (TIGR02145 family)
MNKLKGYVRYDTNEKIVNGSALLAKKKPTNGDWQEVGGPLCYNCINNTGLRAYANYDRGGRVIPGSNITATSKPKIGRWQEISICKCTICDCHTTTTTTTIEEGCCYGLLYNWYAATDVRNIAPVGWHVPTKTEIETLQTEMGGESIAGGHLKETGIITWISQSAGCDNSSGLTLKGAGKRRPDNGEFEVLRDSTFFWSSVLDSFQSAWSFQCSAISDEMNIIVSWTKHGFSLRCIKDDSTDLSTVTGNDGKVYPTVKIGDQVWMSVNSKETKYQNGDTIPEVTGNTEWAALTTGALCAYDNDWNNVCGTSPYTTTTTTTIELN